MGCSMAQHQGTRCHLSSKLASILRKHNTMPYDTHGGGHIGELRLYCPRTEVKFSEMTSGAQRDESSRKISLPSEDNIKAQCQALFAAEQRTRGAQQPKSSALRQTGRDIVR